MSSSTRPVPGTAARTGAAGTPARRSATGVELDYRPSYLAATITGALVFLLYLVTLSPSTAMWDTSEYIASAYVLGLPHPPGNPFFVLIGRFFTILPIGGNPAMKVNILAALCSAVSAGMWFLIAERVLVAWFAQRWQRIAGGALAALIGATSFTVWSQSVVNEKVYTVGLVGLAIISWLTVRWSDDPDGWKADRILVLIGYLLGLGYANHMAGMLAAPAVAVAVLVRRPRTVLRWKLLLAIVGATVLGMTPFATQPIRAAHFPAINEGEPTACENGPRLDCTLSAATKDRFMYNFNRGQYGKPSVLERQAPFSAQIGMWWLYFKWQWMRDAHGDHQVAQRVLAVLFLAFGVIGGWVHWRRDRRSFWYFGTFMFSLTLLLIYYLNFKYGYSQAPDLADTVPREVRDRDYFYLFSFSAYSVWAALGLVFVWESIAAAFGADQVRLGKEIVEQPRRRSWLLASPILGLAIIPLFANWGPSSRRGQTDTADFARDLLNSVEPYGVLVTVGDNDTFPLWYAQEVEGVRRDVTIANTSLLNTDWYVRQLIRRPIYDYDAEKGPAVYREKSWPKPTRPVLDMTMAQADAVPQIYPLEQAAGFRAGSINVTIPPHTLMRADLIVLQMIKDAAAQPNGRPIYLSRTSGGYGYELGLQDHLITQGLAKKLLPVPPTPGRDTMLVRGEGWLDVPRTKALWESFVAPRAIARKGDWVDRPSVGIPLLYVSTGAVLADALEQRGEHDQAQKVIDTAEQVAKATRLDEYFAFRRPTAPPVLAPPAETTPTR